MNKTSAKISLVQCARSTAFTLLAILLHQFALANPDSGLEPGTDVEPDLSARPHELIVMREMATSPDVLFRAWTKNLDQWFAAPGTLVMRAVVGEPFFFETRYGGQRYPHYGRFLELRSNKRIRLTWINGDPGTIGAETVLVLDFEALPNGGTNLRLTHKGFRDSASRSAHEVVWPAALELLDNRMINNNQ